MMKRQGAAMKCCIFCKHWEFYPGHPDWSEVTPGDNWSSRCCKYVWRVGGYSITEEKFREILKTAEACEYYEEVK